MLDVPLDARTECADGPCGQSVGVIIDPLALQTTHLVVEESGLPRTERLVPSSCMVDTTPNLVRLRCKRSDLAAMEPFVETQHAQVSRPDYRAYLQFVGVCVVRDPGDWVSTRHKRIPPGELFVRRGARVRATNGQVGRVDELLVDPTTGRITHLVLRQGSLWRQRDVMVPISEIEHAGENLVYLRLDRNAVESLPSIPAAQWHRRKAP